MIYFYYSVSHNACASFDIFLPACDVRLWCAISSFENMNLWMIVTSCPLHLNMIQIQDLGQMTLTTSSK